ncbi:MAG TPA: transglycosylase SLT domain-containing protein [Thermoleophilaceae bacterium]|nr:transglycosylase SLT domain-containing protein [Thermoleophilaceae bacterium]
MRRRPLLIAIACLLAAGAAVLVLREVSAPSFESFDPRAQDPFAYSPGRRGEFERRAAAGFSHVVYDKSPDGAENTAERVAAYRPLIEAEARRSDLNPDILEALVFLESAGRPDAVAGRDLESAVGLTQILAGTGVGLLDMKVDVRQSTRLTRAIARAARRGDTRRVRRLEARRRRVDERFDPRKALAGAGRYLSFARERLGREDLAFVGYHMGIGNLQRALELHGSGRIPYAELYFGSTPASHRRTFAFFSTLGDGSANYLWRVLAAREIMRLHRHDPGELGRRAELQTAKASAEEVLHPAEDSDRFSSPDDVEAALDGGDLRPFSGDLSANGLRRDPRMGELAPRLEAGRANYQALRPGAYALAVYMARLTREASRVRAPLTVTSTVRDAKYQELLVGRNPEATSNYSLHTTGWAFDVSRRYRNRRQAMGFQYALDRLQALNLIAWAREPAAIHVTASEESERLRDALSGG